MAIRIRTVGVPPPPASSEPSFLQRMGGVRGLLGTATRVGSGMLSVTGGPIGAALTGGGEALAELIEGSKLNPARIAVEGGIGAVPLASVFKLGRAGTSALRSGALSAAGTAGRELAMGEDLNPRAIAESGGLGALLGGVIGKMSSPAKAAPIPTQLLESEPTAQQGGRVLGHKNKGTVDVKGGITRTRVPLVPEPELPMGSFSPIGDMRRPEVPPAWASSPEELQQELDQIARMSGEPSAPSKLDSQLNSWAADDALKTEEQARKRSLINTSGLTPGRPSISQSISATNADGSTIRQSIPFKRASKKSSKTPSIAEQLGVPERNPTHDAGTAPTLGSNLQKGEFDLENPIRGGVQFYEPETLAGFDPSGIAPSGVLGRFFGVQQPLGMPRAPRAMSPAQKAAAESERLLKLKIAEEAQPRPAEWDAYPPEVAQELDRLGLMYRAAPEGLEKRGLGAQLQELKMFMSGKRASGAPYMRDSWRGVPAPDAPVASTTPSGVDPNWVARETAVADDIGNQLKQQAGGPPVPSAPDAPDWVKEQLSTVDKLKALLMGQSGGGSERGEISPDILNMLGGAAGGAVLGSVTNPTGDPLEGAALGGGIGAFGTAYGPSIVKGMLNIGAAPEKIQEAAAHVAAEGPRKTAQRIFETWPQFQRFNMLMSGPGLLANAVVGPWGSAMTGALEAGLSGDERGWRLVKALMTPEVYKKAPQHWEDAIELIRNGDIGRAETILYDSSYGKTLNLPGIAMTTGDVTAREVGKSRGFSEDEMRGMTMTNEPEFTGFQRIAEFTKNSPMLQTVMPFTRTLANLGEQGLMRAPVMGMFVQALREAPDPVKTQLVQQAMSVGIGGANYFLGQELSPEEAKIVRRFATNIAGRYGIIAGAGFAAGQAAQQGKGPLSVAMLRGTQESLPLPTTEIPESWAKFIGAKIEGGEAPLPRGLMPTAFSDYLFPPTQKQPRLPSIRIRRPQ